MAPFIFNDRLQSIVESFTRGTQYFLRDQGTFSNQHQLQIIQQIMRSSANLTLQNCTHRKVKRVQILVYLGPFIFANECWNVGLNPALSYFRAMCQSEVLLKSPRCTMKVLTSPGKQFSFQNVRNLLSECFCTLLGYRYFGGYHFYSYFILSGHY